jgi:hypothetical protein
MTTEDALLFIDANRYLELYRTASGKHLLALLLEQTEHIFVTQQVVDEVKRRKIEVAADFLTQQFTALKLQTYKVPDHLFGTTEEESKSIRGKMEEIHQQIKQVNKDLNALAMGIMEKIRQSNGEVSAVLTPLFAKAVPHLKEEMQRAKQRKQRGQPPGKKAGPIGDELTWEQILSRFVGKKKMWIITKDSNYGTIYDGRGFLNQFLYDELRKVSSDVEAFLFADVADGVKHFAVETGVKADKLPTPEQIQQIKTEENALPPLDWMYPAVRDDPFWLAAFRQRQQRKRAFFDIYGGLNLPGAGTPGLGSPAVLLSTITPPVEGSTDLSGGFAPEDRPKPKE